MTGILIVLAAVAVGVGIGRVWGRSVAILEHRMRGADLLVHAMYHQSDADCSELDTDCHVADTFRELRRYRKEATHGR